MPRRTRAGTRSYLATRNGMGNSSLRSRRREYIAVRHARRGGRGGRMLHSFRGRNRRNRPDIVPVCAAVPSLFGGNAEADGVKAMCRFIEQHLDEPLTLERLAKEFHQSPFHLQRRFKAVLGITPRDYADSCRLKMLKRNLQAGDSVTRAMYDAGYGSSSRLYERTASQLGMTPDKYRRGAIAAAIRYMCADSPLGRMLIAATERGVCCDSVCADRWGIAGRAEARVSFCRAQGG